MVWVQGFEVELYGLWRKFRVGKMIEKRNFKFLRFWGLGFVKNFDGLEVGLGEFEVV
jgi:hypothetical protein